MTREEAVQKVEFACSVPTTPTELDTLFETADIDGPPPIVNTPLLDTTQINFPDQIPPEVAELMPVLPVIAVYTPLASPGPIPEPASLIMVGTGFGMLGLLLAITSRRADGNKRDQEIGSMPESV